MRRYLWFTLAAVAMVAGSLEIATVAREAHAGSTVISGIITEDTIWTEVGSPYIISGDTLIERDITLTIEPGVIIKFDGYYQLEVEGSLSAVGTTAKNILFTRNRDGVQWRRIFAHARGYAQFEHIIAEHAETGIELEQRSPDLRTRIIDSLFRHNGTGFKAGSTVIQGPALIGNTVSNNIVGIGNQAGIAYHTVTNNESHGVTGAGSIYNSVIVNNGGDGVRTSGSIRYSTIEGNKGNGVTAFHVSQIRDTNIVGNGGYAVQVATSSDLNATNNWWGTADAGEIERLIYHFADDRLLGKVSYTPFLTSPAAGPGPTATPPSATTPTPTPPPAPSAERAQTVRDAYWATLGREPDAGGLAYWSDTGLAWPVLLAALRVSEEGLRVTAVRGIYIELLGRDPLGPDNRSLRWWVESRLSLEAIRAGIMQSLEYHSRR